MTKTKAFLQKHRWSLTGALLGALVFLVLYGVRVLDPVCVDWILNNPSPDPSQHYLGWVFYRRSGWHLPYLGTNYSAIYPYRTSILYTDSIPLLAVVCKLLGGVLPARFQYLGLWGLFCYAMQGGLAQAAMEQVLEEAEYRPGAHISNEKYAESGLGLPKADNMGSSGLVCGKYHGRPLEISNLELSNTLAYQNPETEVWEDRELPIFKGQWMAADLGRSISCNVQVAPKGKLARLLGRDSFNSENP